MIKKIYFQTMKSHDGTLDKAFDELIIGKPIVLIGKGCDVGGDYLVYKELQNNKGDGIRQKSQMDSEKPRTHLQNRALHKLFAIVSDQLNNEGQTVQRVLDQMIELRWTPILVKELWRQVQVIVLGKESTTELTTKEIDEVFEPFAKFVADQGLEIHFPSIEELMMQDRCNT